MVKLADFRRRTFSPLVVIYTHKSTGFLVRNFVTCMALDCLGYPDILLVSFAKPCWLPRKKNKISEGILVNTRNWCCVVGTVEVFFYGMYGAWVWLAAPCWCLC